MDNKEQLLIKSVINNLVEAHNSISFKEGDVKDWANYAKHLQSTIASNVAILKTLTHSNFQDEIPKPEDAAKANPSGKQSWN